LGPISDRSGSLSSSSGDFDLRHVSEALLKYQKEVGSLPNLVHTKAAWNASEQLKLRSTIGDARKLGEKIGLQLKDAEDQLRFIPKQQASENRATLVKLTRDFRRIETMLKTLELDFKKKSAAREQQLAASQASSPSGPQHDNNSVSNQQLQLRLEEHRFAEEIMRQREAEVLAINQKMHKVNEIYRDLGQIVSSQQDQIDQVELDMDAAVINAQSGLKKMEEANSHHDKPLIKNPFAKKDSKEEGETISSKNESMCNWTGPLQEMGNDFLALGKRVSLALSFGSKCSTK